MPSDPSGQLSSARIRVSKITFPCSTAISENKTASGSQNRSPSCMTSGFKTIGLSHSCYWEKLSRAWKLSSATAVQSCKTTLRSELLISRPSVLSMKPSFLNLFMKRFTRERVVPIISANVSWEILGRIFWGSSFLP